jgi:light-regulated signal transduction histidine kinase (bacteriophytochrome)
MGRADLMKTSVDLGETVTKIVDELSEDMAGRDINWKISPLPKVIGDSAMLHQVMANLIANAVKFTRPRTKAVIEIGAQVDHPNETLIYVKDNGVGFDAKYVDKLFGLFQRLHTTEEFEGTGVGLANVQRILLRHGGRAWAEGAVGSGATFWFSLPKTKEE